MFRPVLWVFYMGPCLGLCCDTYAIHWWSCLSIFIWALFVGFVVTPLQYIDWSCLLIFMQGRERDKYTRTRGSWYENHSLPRHDPCQGSNSHRRHGIDFKRQISTQPWIEPKSQFNVKKKKAKITRALFFYKNNLEISRSFFNLNSINK